MYHERSDSETAFGIGMANFTDFLRHHQQLMYDNGDNFLAKIINIENL